MSAAFQLGDDSPLSRELSFTGCNMLAGLHQVIFQHFAFGRCHGQRPRPVWVCGAGNFSSRMATAIHSRAICISFSCRSGFLAKPASRTQSTRQSLWLDIAGPPATRSQAGARLVSQPPTPGSVALPVMVDNVAGLARFPKKVPQRNPEGIGFHKASPHYSGRAQQSEPTARTCYPASAGVERPRRCSVTE